MNDLIILGKKIWKALFTKRPYRVVPFEKLYVSEIGAPLDKPESTTGILYKETGQFINYPLLPNLLNGVINVRYIDQKSRYQSSGIFKEPNRLIYSVAGGCITGQAGLVYDAAKRSFIDESAKDWFTNLKYSPYVTALNLPLKKHLPGITISFLTLSADGGFYHFLFESIVKAALFAPLLKQADQLLFNGPAVNWKIKWLDKAGIDTSKIIWMDNSGHYECDQLIFTNRLIADQQIGSWCINSLKKLFVSQDEPLPDISTGNTLFISRKGLSARDIAWEDDILARFPEIEKVDLSGLGADETIIKMQNARCILGAHGAGLSNIYLCRPGTKILEIYPPEVTYQPCYQRIALICKLNYALMYLDFKDKDHPGLGMNTFTDHFLNFKC